MGNGFIGPENRLGPEDAVCRRDPTETEPDLQNQCESDPHQVHDVLNTTNPHRMGLIHPAFDFGTQAIGSHHALYIPTPGNSDDSRDPATTVAWVSGGDDQFSVEPSLPFEVPSSHEVQNERDPLKVVYRPTSPGSHGATLSIRMHWNDGHAETQTIKIAGRAIEESEVGRYRTVVKPTTVNPEPDDTPTPAEIEDSKRTDPYPENARSALDDANTSAAGAVELLQSRMSQAIGDIETEALGYQKAAKHEPVWWDLLEIAATMGAMFVATELVGLFAAELAMVDAVSAAQTEGVVGQLTSENPGFQRPHVHSDHGGHGHGGAAVATEHAFEEGLKEGGKAAIMTVVRQVAEEQEPEKPGAQGTISTDPVVDFFGKQQLAANAFNAHLGTMVAREHRRLRPLLRGQDPMLAGRAMGALTTSITQTSGKAAPAQRRETAKSWVSFSARMYQGSETLHHPDGSREKVTDLGRAGYEESESPIRGIQKGAVDGILEIRVALGLKANATPRLVSARLNGVARSVVARVAKMDLRTAGIPLRIVVDNMVVILRDETGRLQVAGSRGLLDEMHDEYVTPAQALHGAESMTNFVLAKSLFGWGVSIDDDDGSLRSVAQGPHPESTDGE